MTDLTSLTLTQALDGMEKKQFSSAEITDAFLSAIEKANPALNAFVVVTADKARAQGGRAHHGVLSNPGRVHADL